MKLEKEQEIQEKQYNFPYHYLDLMTNAGVYWTSPMGMVEYSGIKESIKKRLLPLRPKRVLDAGCGDGRFIYDMKDSGIKFEGIDYSEAAIGFAKAFNPTVKFHSLPIGKFNPKKKFDCVVFSATMEHIPSKEMYKTLKGIYNSLKPEGHLIVTVPSTNVPTSKKHYRHYTQDSLIQELSPFFGVTSMWGTGKLGWRMKLYQLLFLLPSHSFIIRPMMWFTKKVTAWFNRYLAEGYPEECSGLIVVARKM